MGGELEEEEEGGWEEEEAALEERQKAKGRGIEVEANDDDEAAAAEVKSLRIDIWGADGWRGGRKEGRALSFAFNETK